MIYYDLLSDKNFAQKLPPGKKNWENECVAVYFNWHKAKTADRRIMKFSSHMQFC